MMVLLAGLLGCWGANAYIVQGTVIEVHPPSEVVIDHEDVPGLMTAMVMPFDVRDPALLDGVEPGHRVVARYELQRDGGRLTKLRITGKGPVPELALPPAPLRPGEILDVTPIVTHRGETVVVGRGQAVPTALTFVYTRCPLPEACPAMVARLQALQAALAGHPARLVAVTLDPAYDSVEVLSAYAELIGAQAPMHLGRTEVVPLDDLALRAGLPIVAGSGEIVHGLRLLVLDAQGALVERYDDAAFPAGRVLGQLGVPQAR